MQQFKLGLNFNHVTPLLWFADYVDLSQLPSPPSGGFDWADKVTVPLGMLDNDRLGDCEIARVMHTIMVLKAMGGHAVPAFTNADADIVYGEVNGTTPGGPGWDQGTDMVVSSAFWKKTGYRDAQNVHHKVDDYLAVQVGDAATIAKIVSTFGPVGLGIMVGQTQEDQFSNNEVWNFQAGDKPDGGHAVPVTGVDASGNLCFITWGGKAKMTPKFYARHCQQAVACLSYDALAASGFNPANINQAQLQADWQIIQRDAA